MSDLKTGGTRMRTFKALAKFKGLTQKKIKEITAMRPNSGHLAVILGEEQETGRIRCEQHDENGKDVKYYFLTALGKQDLKSDNVDYHKSGQRIGVDWTKNRRLKTPGGNSKSKKSIKGSKKAKVVKKRSSKKKVVKPTTM